MPKVRWNRDECVVIFDDGVQYEVLEGVVPGCYGKTSDIAFVMGEKNGIPLQLLDYRFGLTLMDTDELIKMCEEVRENERRKTEQKIRDIRRENFATEKVVFYEFGREDDIVYVVGKLKTGEYVSGSVHGDMHSYLHYSEAEAMMGEESPYFVRDIALESDEWLSIMVEIYKKEVQRDGEFFSFALSELDFINKEFMGGDMHDFL